MRTDSARSKNNLALEYSSLRSDASMLQLGEILCAFQPCSRHVWPADMAFATGSFVISSAAVLSTTNKPVRQNDTA